MGDRSNTVITGYENTAPVVLYSHWGGTSFQEVVWKAARSNESAHGLYPPANRVGDPSYFVAGIVALVIDAGLSGIGTTLDENEHPIQVIDAMTGTRKFVDQWPE